MLGVLADNHDFTFSLDDLALFADLLDGRFNLHCVIPYLSFELFVKSYFARHVMRPLSRSYTETSTVTLSPGSILI